MNEIAYAIGDFIIKAFDSMGAEIIGDVFRWGGIAETGYGAIFIMLGIIAVLFIVKKINGSCDVR